MKRYGTFGGTFVSSVSHKKADSKILNHEGNENRKREAARESIKHSVKIKKRG